MIREFIAIESHEDATYQFYVQHPDDVSDVDAWVANEIEQIDECLDETNEDDGFTGYVRRYPVFDPEEYESTDAKENEYNSDSGSTTDPAEYEPESEDTAEE